MVPWMIDVRHVRTSATRRWPPPDLGPVSAGPLPLAEGTELFTALCYPAHLSQKTHGQPRGHVHLWPPADPPHIIKRARFQ